MVSIIIQTDVAIVANTKTIDPMEKEYKQARMEPSCTTVNGPWGNLSALDPNPIKN
jgi:hypothetical protein